MTSVSSFFRSVGWKRLSAVDLPGGISSQHEIQGVNAFVAILGPSKRKPVKSLWRGFSEEGVLAHSSTHDLTWYDTRRNQPHRNEEWRLYYPAEAPPAIEAAEVGDLLVVGEPKSIGPLAGFEIALYVIPWRSDLRNEVLAALGVETPEADEPGEACGTDVLAKASMLALHEEVLRTLEPGFMLAPERDDVEALVRTRFADFFDRPAWERFPRPADLAAFAQSLARIDVGEEPDGALIEMLDIETRAFHVLETYLLAIQVEQGLRTVDEFLSVAQTVMQRRKSRRGRSLELHLEFLFRRLALSFEPQVETDGSTTVDFLFPGKAAYVALPDSPPRDCGVLTLAAKSTCKERWGQVTREAVKLKEHHLCTLQAGISTAQRDEMGKAGVTLVIPDSIRQSYGAAANSILRVADFVERVRRSK